ncbi:hypothetical protein F2P81_014983 [Scophthalmus maximus]|uniref:TOG domain-containing protein n=1 Tax=Scophthalmus maximus TaxID=52904 RepID=A0A6A4SEV5_SCOMX|nr:hypothetical protein F2P81_014983 [Scophthalmus maximus]
MMLLLPPHRCSLCVSPDDVNLSSRPQRQRARATAGTRRPTRVSAGENLLKGTSALDTCAGRLQVLVAVATVKMAAMAAGDGHAAAGVLRGLARHLNCLNEDKSTRKRALEQIKRETVDKGLSGGVLQEVFSALLKPLLKCLSDPIERCRETAIAVIAEFIRYVPKPEESLPYLMPCLAQRLGESEILEPAEELRLSAVEMLTLTVEVCGKHLAPYVNEMINILQRTIVDPFPDVKRESCKCTVKFAECVPEHFYMQAESLVKPLMQTITHQHSRVRGSVIEATRVVIQHGTGKNVDDVLSHLAQRLFDDSPQVRKAVTAVVGDWLLHMRDRYSYFHKLIPLLLSSISDEIPEIRLLAADLWRQVGAQWEEENEDDIKDKMDFLLAPPPFYPPGVERPGLGCRELVVRNLGRLVPAIAHDVTDWLVPTRVRTSQLLSVLLLHAEDHSTQHLQPLLATLYRACTDTERDVVSNSLAAAKLLGTFVPPAVFLKLLLDHVTTPYSSSHPWTPLMVLAAVLGGCSRPLLKPHLEQIANTLTRHDVCQEYQQVIYLEQLLACVDVLLRQCESDCGSVSLQLLQVLVTVQSLSTETNLSEKLLCLEEKLRPQVLSALDEDSQMGRLFACRSVSTILKLIGNSLHPDALNKFYPELLKRLDDSSEEVRGVALQAIGHWLSNLTKDYDPELCAPHLQLLFQQLLLHLDDPDASVQDRVLDEIESASDFKRV